MRESAFFKDTSRDILDMDGQQIEFPICYYDFRSVLSLFTAKTGNLKKFLPHPAFKPIEVFPGIGMLAINAVECYDTIYGQFNEAFIVIPIIFPPKFIIPGLPIISMMSKKTTHLYTHHLPVTSENALNVGIHFWNFPKFMADINFNDQGENLEVTLKEDDRLILKMFAKKLAAKGASQYQIHFYTIRDNVVMHSFADGYAERFGIGKNAGRIEMGIHPISKELTELSLSKTAFSGQYLEGAMIKLYAPDKRWNIDTLKQI